MLESIKVLSFTHYLQGPSAVQALADLGADVIKIESLDGAFERHWSGIDSFLNGVSVYFLIVDKNQKSLSIDLKSPEGKKIIYQLVRESDVVVENFRPGVMDRLGFGYEALKEQNPALIYCSCSGFGSTGPYRNRPGQDLLAQAMSGFMTVTGRRDDPPIPVGTAIADQHAARLAAMGILAALYARTESGKGMKIDNSLLNACLDLQIEPMTYYLNGFQLYDRSRTGLASRVHQAPYGVYQTADGYLCMAITPPDKLAAAFADESFLAWSEQAQFTGREQLNEKVCQAIRRGTTQHWIRRFQETGVWFAEVNTYDQVERNPQVNWNDCIFEFDHPVAGRVRLLANPVKYDGRRPSLRRMPPELGEQTQEILTHLGYSEQQIDGLVRANVVKRSREDKSVE